MTDINNNINKNINKNIQALIFDVDGTLYHQQRLRRAMLLKLARTYVFRPFQGRKTMRILSAYRNAQETIREADATHIDLAQAQLTAAVHRSGYPEETVRECVEHWMEREPLPLLPGLVYPALAELLETAHARGLRLAVVSDYPAHKKLAAMRLDHHFEVIVAAQEAEVGRFKPHPRGIEVALARLKVSPEHALYVGDRAEVDAEAARRAGVGCVIVSKSVPVNESAHWHQVSHYRDLHSLLFDR